MTETPWQQYERLAYTECQCGHILKDHGARQVGTVCLVSRCECDNAEPAQ